MSLRDYLFHAEPGVTLYCGDAREVLPLLDVEPLDTCIVDPVWPNSKFPLVTDPAKLFAEVAALVWTQRFIVHLGCMSDPRFLSGMPDRFPYLRTCWLRYAHPSYLGRVLMGADVAYAFGVPPSSRPGRRLLPGETTARNNSTKLQHTGRGTGSADKANYEALPHPAPRRFEHVRWLAHVFADTGVLDPCAGTGTTLEAAKELGLTVVGIETEAAYCEIAVKRLRQEVLTLPEPEDTDW